MNRRKITVGLAGNPNSGKTTIFNNLTGSNQKVGNWSGVTVEKKEGTVLSADYEINFIDLPGTYSLTAYSIEEKITRDFICFTEPDLILNVVDASNIERNLYLTTQLVEIGIPTVIALNMVDEATEKGIVLNENILGSLFGFPTVKTIGRENIGTDNLLKCIVDTFSKRSAIQRSVHINFGNELEEELHQIEQKITKTTKKTFTRSSRWLSLKLLEGDKKIEEYISPYIDIESVKKQVARSQKKITAFFEEDPESLLADRRYSFISGTLKESMKLDSRTKSQISDKIDLILTNRILAIPIFILFMWLMFQLTFKVGQIPQGWLESGIEWLKDILDAKLNDSLLKTLFLEGIIEGVGGVIVFLPNILLLFLAISFLEDTGYMARAAFIMDRAMHLLGLHGKAFIPLLMGFGCSVPAVMASRTIENHKDRILTILITPIISCSARLPVYVLIAGSFFGANAGNVLFFLYLLSILMAILMGMLFKRVFFHHEEAPFVMELPPYRVPTVKSIFWHMWEKGSEFLKKAGTVILAGSLLIWILKTYPREVNQSKDFTGEIKTIQETYNVNRSKLDSQFTNALNQLKSEHKTPFLPFEETTVYKEINQYYIKQASGLSSETNEKIHSLSFTQKSEELEQKYIGRLGKSIEPFITPLGFSWKEGVALIAGVVAKEIVISTLQILYSVSEETDNLSEKLKETGFTKPIALGFMVFVLLYTPCIPTLFIIKKETGWKWAFFSATYPIFLAWIVSYSVINIFSWFSGGVA